MTVIVTVQFPKDAIDFILKMCDLTEIMFFRIVSSSIYSARSFTERKGWFCLKLIISATMSSVILSVNADITLNGAVLMFILFDSSR